MLIPWRVYTSHIYVVFYSHAQHVPGNLGGSHQAVVFSGSGAWWSRPPHGTLEGLEDTMELWGPL